MRTLLVATLTGSIVLSVGGSARADGDALSPRAMGVGESLRAAATGALAISLNPAGLALGRSYVIEGAYAYRPDDHSHIQAVSICDSVTTRVAACIFYNHLSSDPSEPGDRSLHEAGITTAVPLGAFTLGVTNKYVSYHESMTESVPVDSSRKGFTFDAGLTYQVMPMLAVGMVVYNLFGSDDDRYTRAFGGGIAISAMPRLLLAADARYDFERESGRYGGGVEFMFGGSDKQQGLPIRGGYVYDSGTKGSYLTGGLGFVTPRLAVDAAARKQVSEGDELMIQFGLRVFLPN